MPGNSTMIDCVKCKKSVRSDKLYAHYITHLDDLCSAMTPATKTTIKEKQIPVVFVYDNDHKNVEFAFCMECKKYSRRGSERNGRPVLWWKEHCQNKTCKESFEKYKSMFDVTEIPKEHVVTPVEVEPEAFENELITLLEIEYDDAYAEDATKREAIVSEIKSNIGFVKKAQDNLRKYKEKYDKIISQKDDEMLAYKQKQVDLFMRAIRKAIVRKDAEEAESFNEQINDYDKLDFPELHTLFDTYLYESAGW